MHAAVAAVAAMRPGESGGPAVQLAAAAEALGAAGLAVYLKDPTSGAFGIAHAVGDPVADGGVPDGAVPLRVGDDTIGMLAAVGLPAEHDPALRSTATVLSLVLQNRQLFEALQGRARDLDREVRLLMGMQQVAAAATRATGIEAVATVVASHGRRMVRGTLGAVVSRAAVLAQEGNPRPVAITAGLAAISQGTVQELPGPLVAIPIDGEGTDGGTALVVGSDGGVFSDDTVERLTSLAGQAAIAFANARLLVDLRAEQDHRAQIAAALVHAQERERQRIAEDIHDGPIQELVGLGLIMDVLSQELTAEGSGGVDTAAGAAAAARAAVGTLREAIFDLHPMSLEQLGFAAAVHVVLNRATQRGLTAEMHDLDAVDALAVPLRTVAFRVVQEAVANVIRHANASTVAVSAGKDGPHVWVEVADDGRGFDRDAASEGIAGGHLGLEALEERARLVGAELGVRSDPRTGTVITLRFPGPPDEGSAQEYPGD